MMMRMYYLRIDSGITAGQPDEIRMDCVKLREVRERKWTKNTDFMMMLFDEPRILLWEKRNFKLIEQ